MATCWAFKVMSHVVFTPDPRTVISPPTPGLHASMVREKRSRNGPLEFLRIWKTIEAPGTGEMSPLSENVGQVKLLLFPVPVGKFVFDH